MVLLSSIGRHLAESYFVFKKISYHAIQTSICNSSTFFYVWVVVLDKILTKYYVKQISITLLK